MTPSLEGWPTKAKEAPSPHEVRLAPLHTNPVFQSLGGDLIRGGYDFEETIIKFYYERSRDVKI